LHFAFFSRDIRTFRIPSYYAQKHINVPLFPQSRLSTVPEAYQSDEQLLAAALKPKTARADEASTPPVPKMPRITGATSPDRGMYSKVLTSPALAQRPGKRHDAAYLASFNEREPSPPTHASVSTSKRAPVVQPPSPEHETPVRKGTDDTTSTNDKDKSASTSVVQSSSSARDPSARKATGLSHVFFKKVTRGL